MYWKKYIGATPGSPEELESANPIRHTLICMELYAMNHDSDPLFYSTNTHFRIQ